MPRLLKVGYESSLDKGWPKVMANTRTSRKQFMSGMKELQGIWETKLDRHIKDGDTKGTVARNILRPLPHYDSGSIHSFYTLAC